MTGRRRVALSQLELADITASPATAAPVEVSSNGSRDARRQLGAFYTPQGTAQLMADWVLRTPSDRILEPSYGDGSFLSVVKELSASRGWADVEISGVEIDQQPFEEAISRDLISRERAILRDFLDVPRFPVDAVIGNPPYVRLRHLPDDQNDRALRITEELLGTRMESSGSVWMPFVLHAAQFLRPGGRMALVLPYELTYVRYARPLWAYLAANFGDLSVIRAHDRLFPDLLQEAVVLLADAKGHSTTSVELKAFENIEDLNQDRPAIEKRISVDRIISGERVFLEALLSEDLQELLVTRIQTITRPASDYAGFHIGYVSGDKTFFQPTPEAVTNFNLPATSLIPSLTSTRKLKGIGLMTSDIPGASYEPLFMPNNPTNLTGGELAYIEYGESQKVHERYKCRVRNPWFIVPWVKTPDLILSVFCELPLLMINDAEFVASNSLLCGYMRDEHATTTFAASWYTSLTALQCELQVHSLGGGVLVLVPRETGNVRIPWAGSVPSGHLERLGHFLSRDRLEDAYSLGDQTILNGICRLSLGEIDLIEEGTATLRHWRSGRS